MKKNSTKLMKNFGMKVKLERTKRGFSQEKLAELSNLSFRTIGTIERAESSPTIDTVKAIADALQIPLPEMFNFNF